MVLPTRSYLVLQGVLKHTNYTNIIQRSASSRSPQAVFIDKQLEEPVVVVRENDYVDIIGPPDVISNLRPVIRSRLLNETNLQQRLREMQDATQKWNQEFWAKHNTNFLSLRQKFIDSNQVLGEDKRQLNADEMSKFYKDFLDSNWRMHVNYNLEWYRKNFTMVFLALRVSIEKNVLKVL